MSIFRQRVLGMLDRIYGFVGPVSSTNNLDLSAPVQLVHDVSRQAALGTHKGFEGGYVSVPLELVVAGAGYDHLQIELYPYLVTNLSGFDADRHRVWALRVDAYTEWNDLPTITDVTAGVVNGPGGMEFIGPAYQAIHMMFFGDGTGSNFYAGPGADRYGLLANLYPGNPYPILLVPGGSYLAGAANVTGGIATPGVLFHFLLWVALKDVPPPGLA